MSDHPVENARLFFGDLVGSGGVIPGGAINVRLARPVPTAQAVLKCDPLIEVDNFAIEKCAALSANIKVPKDIPAGIYKGSVALLVDGSEVALNKVEVEVANIDLPDPHNWNFFLNVCMNPASVARWYGVEMWSEEHFRRLTPYIEDLAAHGQKVVAASICHQPGSQYPNAVIWKKCNGKYTFDFNIFDRYVELHARCGIDAAIYCYVIIPGAGETDTDQSVISYIDTDTGEEKQVYTTIGDPEYIEAWSAFFAAFRKHLIQKNWFWKTYIAFDEKQPDVMEKLAAFMNVHASDFLIAYAADILRDAFARPDDLSIEISVNNRGIAEMVPPERAMLGIADMLALDEDSQIKKNGADKARTTFHICNSPDYPNVFLSSPLVESRMLPFLAMQGGFNGLLRWSYNDWPDAPLEDAKLRLRPADDAMFVYPGEHGPISSLRWEQLRESIYDYELATIASEYIRTPDEMVDYQQALTLACRNPNGHLKSVGDIEIARRLLIPIAEHKNE